MKTKKYKLRKMPKQFLALSEISTKKKQIMF